MEQLPSWQPSWHAGVGPQPTPPEPTSTAFTNPLEDENPDEWEYEYSTTEIETYYVTLDLSSPDPDQPAIPDPSVRRAVRWANPAIGRHRRPNLSEAPTFGVKISSNDPESLNPIDDQEEINKDETSAPRIEEPRKPPPVQILGLHSQNPIVSYDGQVYSCEWAQNLGTELLFTASEGNPHPYLKTVQGDIDILGASSARIISKAIEIQPRSAPQQYVRKAAKKKDGYNIPVGPGAKPVRREQANFLERLIEIKEKKGEKDMVTVHALKRQYNRAWKEEFKKKRQNERTRLKRLVKKGGVEGAAASSRLVEMDKEDKERLQEEGELGTETGRARKKRVKFSTRELADAVPSATTSYKNMSYGTQQSKTRRGDEMRAEYESHDDESTLEELNGSDGGMDEDTLGEEVDEDAQMYDEED